MPLAPQQLGSTATTRDIRVDVTPEYMPDQSKPEARSYVFGYKIKITNAGKQAVQLLGRHWIIVDANSERHEVMGEGVVGHQPALAPKESFEYSSYCPLATPWGTMEGTFSMVCDGGEQFKIAVARFYLVAGE